MPLLDELIKRATTPIVSQSVTQPTVDALTQPHLNQSPTMARIKGFGAGALEGIRNLTSPVNLAGVLGDDAALGLPAFLAANKFIRGATAAAPEISAASKYMSYPEVKAATQAATDILNPATAKVMDRMYNAAKPTFEAMKGAFAGDRTVGGLNSLASRAATAPPAPVLGQSNAYFTPVGAENLYNAGKKVVQGIPDVAENTYNRILSTMGK